MATFLCATSCAAVTRPRVSLNGANRAQRVSKSWVSLISSQPHHCCTAFRPARQRRKRGTLGTSAAEAPGSVDEFREKITWEQIEEVMKQDTVGNIMSKNVKSIHEKASVFEAMKTLVDNRVSSVPVVNDKNNVVGVISEYDLMTRLGRTTSAEEDGMFPRIGRCDEFGGSMKDMWERFKDLQERMEKASGTRVCEAMQETHTVKPNMLLVDATELMLTNRYHRLSVVDDKDTLIGVLSRGDVMRRTFQVYTAAQKDGSDAASVQAEIMGADPSDPAINSEPLVDGGLEEFCDEEPDSMECKIYSF